MIKLKDKKLINKLFDKKATKYAIINKIKMVYYKSDVSGVLVSAPTSIFKTAVDRNRVKRLLRESLVGVDTKGYIIGFIYNNDKIESFDSINKTIKELLTKLK